VKILPICYFPPVHWYAALIREKKVFLEVCQHYRKQQLTSRTHIRVSNRVLPLTIPVRRRGAKIPVKDKKISFGENWQLQHWRSLKTAYRNSPYFEYYAEEIHQSLMHKEEGLMEYLLIQLDLLNRMLSLDVQFELTKAYEEEDKFQRDLRGDFDPSLKKLPNWFYPVPYPQVFQGFEAGLSILDLLFNMGPEARIVLLEAMKD